MSPLLVAGFGAEGFGYREAPHHFAAVAE